jgi:hydroxymethylbilane synthase
VGTRGSLLALTQCKQFIHEFSQKTGLQFEIKIISTQGDKNTKLPLWQMAGENFFTKELDQALINQEVDLVVHSYKDLGSKRPPELDLAALSRRQFSQDILLIPKKIKKKLPQLDSFTMGTSSPRRIANLTFHLKNYLPGVKEQLSINTQVLRGNINTRIQKLQNGDYQAIVLALAGLERLAIDPTVCKDLALLLEELDFMILPTTHFPTAASQGALAVEVLKTNQQLKDQLKIMNDQDTRLEIIREREAFNHYGGGCHLAVGINVKKIGPYFAHFHQGELAGKRVATSYLERPAPIPPVPEPYFIGMPLGDEFLSDKMIKKNPLEGKEKIKANFFVTSRNCFSTLDSIYQGGTLWSAGPHTMKKLAKAGYWPHGSTDALGEKTLMELKNSQALNLMMDQKQWVVLTHDQGSSPIGRVIPSYTRSITPPSKTFKHQILACNAFFWASFHQYEQYVHHFPEIKDRFHACGPGKTFKQFTNHGLKPTPFLNTNEFLKTLRGQ